MLRSVPGWIFEWLPSHQSKPRPTLRQRACRGNEKADEAVKAQARAVDISPVLLAKWAENQAAVEAVWRLLAEFQVSHLSERPRRVDGSAVKARRWKAPARPGRTTCRRMQDPQRDEPQAAAADARPAAASNGRLRSAEFGARWPVLPAAAGVHDMAPAAGPIPQMGFAKSAAGTLQWRWSCRRCGQLILNSSKLFELLRTPCGEPGE